MAKTIWESRAKTSSGQTYYTCSFARGFANRHLSRAYLNGQSGNSSALPHVDHRLLADARARADQNEFS